MDRPASRSRRLYSHVGRRVALPATERHPLSLLMRKWVYGFLVLFAVAVAVYYPYSPAGRQAANMRAAETHIASLLPRVKADPRFDGVRLVPGTVGGGSLEVVGVIADEPARAALERIVAGSHSPVPVAYRLVIVPGAAEPAATRPQG